MLPVTCGELSLLLLLLLLPGQGLASRATGLCLSCREPRGLAAPGGGCHQLLCGPEAA